MDGRARFRIAYSNQKFIVAQFQKVLENKTQVVVIAFFLSSKFSIKKRRLPTKFVFERLIQNFFKVNNWRRVIKISSSFLSSFA